MVDQHIPGVVQAEVEKARAEGRIDGMAIALRIARSKMHESEVICSRWEGRPSPGNVIATLRLESAILSELVGRIDWALTLAERELDRRQ